jgi:hypothetical protein
VNPDGSGKRRTTDIETVHVTASRNGEVIEGAQWHQGLRLGRLAGSEFTLLDERQPAWHNDVSPDGRWVAYINMDTELWKVPTAGGPATKLLGSWVFRLRFTRDGRSVVVLFKQPDRPWEIGVVPLDGGGLAHRQPVPADTDVIGGLRPTDDGTAVDLVRRHAGVTNIWRVPLAAGEPVQLTHFVEQARIHGFDWSHDGRLLAVVRGGWRGDIVLLRGEW